MIDFPILYESGTPHWAWTICGLGYFLIFVLYYRRVVNNSLWSKTTIFARYSLFCLVFIFSVCAFYTGDFSHYQLTVKTEESIDHLEEVYHWLIGFVNHNYFLFRFLLWGGGTVFIFLSFRDFGISPYRSLFYLFASYITFYSYTRAGVAQAIFFIGFAIFFNRENRTIIFRLCGLVLLLLSFFFHRSLLVLVILSPLCFLPINKYTFPIYVFAILVVIASTSIWLNNALHYLMEYEEYSEVLEIYTSTGGDYVISRSNRIIPFITYYWGKAIFHVPFWCCMISISRHKNRERIPNGIKAVIRLSLVLYIFIIVTLFSFGSASAFYYRYERMLVIPVTVMVNYLYQENIFSQKTYRNFILLGSILMMWDFFYRIIFT